MLNRWAFSENTDLSEVLVVARRKRDKSDGKDAETIFVNLWGNPSSSGDALAIAAEINAKKAAPLGTIAKPVHGISELRVGSHKFGEMLSIPWKLVGDLWEGKSCPDRSREGAVVLG